MQRSVATSPCLQWYVSLYSSFRQWSLCLVWSDSFWELWFWFLDDQWYWDASLCLLAMVSSFGEKALVCFNMGPFGMQLLNHRVLFYMLGPQRLPDIRLREHSSLAAWSLSGFVLVTCAHSWDICNFRSPTSCSSFLSVVKIGEQPNPDTWGCVPPQGHFFDCLLCPRLASNLLCSPGWPATPYAPASTSKMLDCIHGHCVLKFRPSAPVVQATL